MAKRQVEYVIKADSKDAFNASRRLMDSAKRYGENLEEAGNRGARGFDNAAASMTKLITGAGALLTAWRLINSEIDQTKRLQSDAAETVKTLGGARQELITNLPKTMLEEEVQKLFKQISDISDRTKAPETAVTLATGTAYSASGGDLPAAIKAVETASLFKPERPDILPELSGALLDTRHITGTTDPLVNLGYLTQTAELSRIADPALQYKNIAGSVAQLTKKGLTPREAGAFYSAVTNLSGDVTGEASRTAALTFAGRMKEYLGGQGVTGLDFRKQIEYIQQDPKLAEEILKSMGGQERFKETFRGLLTAGSEDDKLFDEFYGMFSAGREAFQTAGEKKIGMKGYDPLYKNVELGLAIKRLKKSLEKDPKMALAGQIREDIIPILPKLGRSALATKLEGLLFEGETYIGTQDVEEAGIDIITGEMENMLRPTPPQYTAFGKPARQLDWGFREPGDYSGYEQKRLTEKEGDVYRVLADIRKILVAISNSNNQTANNTKGRETYDRPVNE